jgi:hypothetical protein
LYVSGFLQGAVGKTAPGNFNLRQLPLAFRLQRYRMLALVGIAALNVVIAMIYVLINGYY